MNSNTDPFAQAVEDARLLLDHAVSSGWKAEDGRSVGDDLIASITNATASVESSGPSERAEFKKAYRDLSLLMAPVTAATLRATDKQYGTRCWSSLWLAKVSDASHWSRVLIFLTLFFAGLAVGHTWLDQSLGQYSAPGDEGGPSIGMILRDLLGILEPFVYGGLGACAYLLKICHTFIHKRTFDINRKPEYLNRIALGLLGGGMIVLFVNEIGTGDDGADQIQLSAAALGFLAGYSTDFLFQTIERVTAAILPKVSLDTVKKAGPPALESVSLDALAERLTAATDPEDKKAIRALIEKARDRL